MNALTAAWNDRRTRIVIIVVGALFVVGIGLRLAGVGTSRNDSDSRSKTARYGLSQFECRAMFNRRIGHSPTDNAFWAALVDCANAGLLPPGQNDPGYYAP